MTLRNFEKRSRTAQTSHFQKSPSLRGKKNQVTVKRMKLKRRWNKILSACVLVGVSIAVTKHHDHEASWGGRAYSAHTSTLLFTTEGSQYRNSSRDLEAGAHAEAMVWGLLTGLLLIDRSACLLIEPGIEPPTMGWGWALPHWLPIEKMPYSWISWRHFLN